MTDKKMKVCGVTENGDEVCILASPYSVARDASDEDIAKVLFQSLNNYGRGLQEAISVELLREHNTIQQNFFRTIDGVTKDYSAKMKAVDARNENSKKWADKVVEATEDIRFPMV